MDSTQPSWLVEPCPTWCVRDHTEVDHPEDRVHASEATLVPVIGTRDDQALATESVASFDLVVQLRRGVGELFDWVAVEPTESHHPRLMLSRESAAVVAAAMSELANSSPR